MSEGLHPDVRVNGVPTAVILEQDLQGARGYYAVKEMNDSFCSRWRKHGRLAPGSVVRVNGDVVHIEPPW